MTEKAKYFDKRADFFREYFDTASPYSEYLEGGTEVQQEKWNGFYSSFGLTTEQQEVVKSFSRKLNLLVLSGIWCGDCARQGPIFQKIAELNPLIDLRFIESREHEALQDELRVLGGTRVPVVVMLSEDFYELTRFGDRTLSKYRIKAQNELGAACDPGLVPPSLEELQQEAHEWIELFERAQLMLRLAPALRQRYSD